MYILFFLLELINIYVVFNVVLKSATWFTTSVQVPVLNYLNTMANIPTKYFLLPRLHIDTSDDTECDSSDDTVCDSSDDSSDDSTEEEDSSSDETPSGDNVTEVSSSSDSSDDSPDDSTEKEVEPIPNNYDSSDSEDEVKHLPVKPSVIIMDEKLD
jgi:hypothetical protein